MPPALERFCNRINDWDVTWLGVRRIRPTRDQAMSVRIVALLCLLYCPLSAAVGFAISYAVLSSGRHPLSAPLPWAVAAAAALAFLLLQSLFARAWNQRAARLRTGQSG